MNGPRAGIDSSPPDAARAFQALLEPRRVAIVGLSADPAKHGRRVLGHLRRLGFQGEVWGVHPGMPAVAGVAMFPSVPSLPTAPDLVVCAVPATAAAEVARQAGEIGASAVIVFAGGFAEAGAAGRRMQEDLRAVARAGGARVLGPNSGGVIFPGGHLAASFLTCLDRPADQIRSGPVGLVTQSGGTGSYLHNLAAARGSGFAVSISTGNEADLDAADAIDALVDRPEVAAVAVVLETVRRGPEFVAALRKSRRAGKPVLACHLGRSERGTRLMITHTGALAGPARVLQGVLDAEGVAMVETPADLFDAAEVMARSPRPAGGRTAVVSHSGGMAILLSDLAERSGVDLPLPRPELARRLDPLLELGAAENPLDMGGIIGGPHRFGQVVEAFVDSDDYDMVLAVTTAHPPTHTLTRAEDLAAIGTNKPLIHLWLAGDLGDEGLASLRAAGTPVSEEPRAAMAALAGLGRLAALREEGPPGPEVLLEVPAVVGTASEHEAKGILAGLGVPVVEGELARSGEEAVFMARRLGYPVVVKVSSRQIAHKTEIEGLLTGVTDEAGVLRAFDQVMAAGRSVPGAAVDGVRVERQRRGLEMIVGAVRDPTFGPTVLVGFGGTYAEALDDVGVAPAPITSGGAMRMISMLQGHRVLSAPRRGTPPDLEGLSRIIVRLGEILCSSDWAEIEINPLVWTGEAWEALDALVRGPDRLGPSGS